MQNAAASRAAACNVQIRRNAERSALAAELIPVLEIGRVRDFGRISHGHGGRRLHRVHIRHGREDIGIDLDGTTLVITARHSSESGEKDKDGNYLRRERKFGSFSRSFDVSGVDTEHISAAYKNGVLELTLPKQAAQVPQARRIEIAGE